MNLPHLTNLPKAIAIDLDGTLLNSRSELSRRNYKAIERCLLLGIPVILATARTERSIIKLIGPDLVNRCSLVMLNGAIIKGAKPLSGYFRETIEPGIAAEIVATILKMEPTVRITVEIDGFIFGCNIQSDPVQLWEINSATPDMVCSIEEAIARFPSKIAVNGLGKNLSPIAKHISYRFGNYVHIIPSDEMTFLNIPSIKASKTIALRKLLERKNISLEQLVSFGDDIPDLDMLTSSGISIAMKNAKPEILAAAKYRTSSNDDDGVALALEKIIDIQNPNSS
jgi:Cof subfamily protein (haloacid dehalogenase superfamily)